MNQYEGAIDDGRFSIHEEHGQELWGWPLREANSPAPAVEESWHLWRLCDPFGWCHVVKIEAKEPEYLRLLTKRLDMQARVSDEFGQQEYARMNEKERDAHAASKQADADQLYKDVMEENSWLTRKAKEAFDRGETQPTNPTKDTIITYPGQGTKGRIVTPLSDKEGGLVLPDEWRTE